MTTAVTYPTSHIRPVIRSVGVLGYGSEGLFSLLGIVDDVVIERLELLLSLLLVILFVLVGR